MITAPALREMAAPGRPDRTVALAMAAACAAADALALGLLVLGAPLPAPLTILAAAVSHGTAVLLVSGLAGAEPSRRWLSGAAVLAVPFLGAFVCAAVLVTRGRGSAVRRRRASRGRPTVTLAAVQRLANALSMSDALVCGDADQRRAALSALSRREDPEAIALLRRTAASRDADLALSAALALDEIRERAEHENGRAAWRPA